MRLLNKFFLKSPKHHVPTRKINTAVSNSLCPYEYIFDNPRMNNAITNASLNELITKISALPPKTEKQPFNVSFATNNCRYASSGFNFNDFPMMDIKQGRHPFTETDPACEALATLSQLPAKNYYSSCIIDKPLIGYGIVLASACQQIVINKSEEVYFYLPHLRLGISFPYLPIYMMLNHFGYALATELILSERKIPGQEVLNRIHEYQTSSLMEKKLEYDNSISSFRSVLDTSKIRINGHTTHFKDHTGSLSELLTFQIEQYKYYQKYGVLENIPQFIQKDMAIKRKNTTGPMLHKVLLSHFKKPHEINHALLDDTEINTTKNKSTTFNFFSEGKNLNLAIIGGSIAGLACQFELEKIGIATTLYESNPHPAKMSGNGIVIPDEIARYLSRNSLMLEEDFLQLSSRPIYLWDPKTQKSNHLSTHSISGHTLSWHTLYQALEQQRRYENRLYGQKVITINNLNHGIEVKTSQSESAWYDGCIFADGTHSIGRQHFDFNEEIVELDYVIIRGVAEIEDRDLLKSLHNGVAQFYVFQTGHLLFYLIKSSHNPQNYLLNWALYESSSLIKDLIPKNRFYLRLSQQMHLNQFERMLRAIASPAICNAILRSPEIIVRKLFEVDTKRYYANNSVIVGDAAAVLRPHAISGVANAISDAISLAGMLQKSKAFSSSSLQQWSDSKSKRVTTQWRLGQAVGRFFVENPPNWKKTSSQALDEQWNDIANGWYFHNKPSAK